MKHYKSLFAVKNERIIICKASSPQLTRMLNDVKAIAQPYKINNSEALPRVICGRALFIHSGSLPYGGSCLGKRLLA